MSKRRLRFSKLGMAKYISHLDLLRCFNRSIMRAELPVKYSQGFNPHQKMTFSLPLSIGVTSACETVDIDFEDTVSDSDILFKLNDNLPPDIKILEVYDITESANNIVSAKYIVTLVSKISVPENDIREFFGQGEVLIMKKTKKKGDKQVNLMDFVKQWNMLDSYSTPEGVVTEIELILSAGGQSNLKPEIAVNTMIECLDIEVSGFDIHRTNIYCENNGLIQEFR